MAKTNLFLYGTLKRGGPAHHLLAGQVHVADAWTQPRYRLLDLGPYPCLIHAPHHGTTVHGEVWSVDEVVLCQLDAYESEGTLYRRETIDLQGIMDATQAYFYLGKVAGLRDCGERWP